MNFNFITFGLPFLSIFQWYMIWCLKPTAISSYIRTEFSIRIRIFSIHIEKQTESQLCETSYERWRLQQSIEFVEFMTSFSGPSVFSGHTKKKFISSCIIRSWIKHCGYVNVSVCLCCAWVLFLFLLLDLDFLLVGGCGVWL